VAALLGPDYRRSEVLVRRLDESGVAARWAALVWDVDMDGVVTLLVDGRTERVRGEQLIAATGAMERATPISGWTLPGVLNAGAAQIALKASGTVPDGRIVLAGAGPLLLLVACQLLDAGAQVAAVVETAPATNRLRALSHLPGALGAPSMLAKGLAMLRRLRAARVPRYRAAESLAVEGDLRVEALRFVAGGRAQRVEADVVLLHHGVLPNTQLTRLLRVEHLWDEAQLSFRPRVDAWGQSSRERVRVAGDGAGIAGAIAAEHAGAIAAIGAAHAIGGLDASMRDREAAPLRAALDRELRVRPFLDALYRPPPWVGNPADEVVVCRCEEVSAGRIREMARLGCRGPNQTKFFSRCGMGPCQGRVCGNVVTQILAAETGRAPAEVGAYRVRPPLKPVPIAAIAALADPSAVPPIPEPSDSDA
jgi:NADPH-dependent 2,4-dienoyl-CoA reductase/sulfur reductase-like enzyme